MDNKLDWEWLNETTTISREELATIFAEEMRTVTQVAKSLGDKALADFLKELLIQFSASVSTKIFDEEEEEE